MVDKRGKQPPGPPPLPKQKREDEAPESERPTINPPFDVEAYAREATASAPESRRRYSPDAPTRPPPAPGVPADLGDADIPVEVSDEEARSRQITITNEVELEHARAKSAEGS